MNKPLYAIADEYLLVARSLADLDLPEEVINDTLEGASGDLENKFWNLGALILQFEGEAAMMKDAEQRIASRRKSMENRVNWMREYLLVQLIRTGFSAIESPEFVISVRDNPPKVVLDNEDAIPKAYKHSETVVSILKAEIRKALLDGKTIAGAHLEREKRLAIK